MWPRPLPTQSEGGAGKDCKSAELGYAKYLEELEGDHDSPYISRAFLRSQGPFRPSQPACRPDSPGSLILVL